MCTAEAPVTHSICTDMTARPIRLNASGLTMRQHVQHPNQMQYTTACSQHDGSPRVHRRSQPCDYVHTLARERSGLKRTSTWNAGAQDPAPSSRVKRSWSRPELGTGGVLDRNERKIDSANLIHGEEDRKAREIREKERVKREGVQPRYMQAKN